MDGDTRRFRLRLGAWSKPLCGPGFGEAASKTSYHVGRPQNGSLGGFYVNPLSLELAQAFDELLAPVFAVVREADLLLRARAERIAIDDDARQSYR